MYGIKDDKLNEYLIKIVIFFFNFATESRASSYISKCGLAGNVVGRTSIDKHIKGVEGDLSKRKLKFLLFFYYTFLDAFVII